MIIRTNGSNSLSYCNQLILLINYLILLVYYCITFYLSISSAFFSAMILVDIIQRAGAKGNTDGVTFRLGNCGASGTIE